MNNHDACVLRKKRVFTFQKTTYSYNTTEPEQVWKGTDPRPLTQYQNKPPLVITVQVLNMEYSIEKVRLFFFSTTFKKKQNHASIHLRLFAPGQKSRLAGPQETRRRLEDLETSRGLGGHQKTSRSLVIKEADGGPGGSQRASRPAFRFLRTFGFHRFSSCTLADCLGRWMKNSEQAWKENNKKLKTFKNNKNDPSSHIRGIKQR